MSDAQLTDARPNEQAVVARLSKLERFLTVWEITKSVLVFLGIPLVAGFLTRLIGEKRKGAEWHEQTFLPRIGPIALYGLLFTIVILFASQGDAITEAPLDVARFVGPLIEVPALVGLLYVALWARRRFYPHYQATEGQP